MAKIKIPLFSQMKQAKSQENNWERPQVNDINHAVRRFSNQELPLQNYICITLGQVLISL